MLRKFLLIFIICFASPNGITAELDLGFSLYQSENFTEAFPRLLVLAKSGDSKAAGLVARMYVFGLGTQVDKSEAYRWGSEAAKQDDPLAQNLLGILYKNGWGVAKNLEDSIFWFKKSADQNFILAFANLGDAYAYGQGVSIDRNEALKWYERAALADNAYALFMASILIDSIDKEKSFNYLKASAAQGFGDAMASLGDKYYNGDFVTKNYYEARKWYELASNTKSRYANHAVYMLGYMAFWGNGEPKNIEKAIKLYQKVSDAGEIYALNELGRIYQNGIGVEENQELAFHYYLRSANLGNEFGQVQSAMHLMDGRGVSKDTAKAKKYLQLSAKQGNLLARLNLLDLEIADGAKTKQLSKALLDIKSLALEYQNKFPKAKIYKDIEESPLIQRAHYILGTNPRDENKFTWNSEAKTNAKALIQEINFSLKNDQNSEEALDCLKLAKYFVEKHFNGTLFGNDTNIYQEPEKSRLAELYEEIRLFSNYLMQKYPSNHDLYVDALRLKFYYQTNVTYEGKKSDIEQLVNDFIKPSSIAAQLAVSNISDESTCALYVNHLSEWIYMNMVRLIPAIKNKTDLTNEISSITAMAEDSDYCLDKFSFDSIKTSLILLVNENDNSLNAYLRQSLPNSENFRTDVASAKVLGNTKKVESLLNEQYAESKMRGAVVELIEYYFRDKQFEKVQSAIRRKIKEGLSSEYGWYDSDLLSKLAKLPQISPKQKIYLLKKSVELNKSNFYLFTENYKADEILGTYDWSDHDTERALIEELFEQKRNVEAELIIRFLKIKEVSELLRDAEIKNHFVLPEWFYTDDEKQINKFFQKYLDVAIKNFRLSGMPNYITGENINNLSEAGGDKFVDFLISGHLPKQIRSLKKENPIFSDRLGLLINSLPPKTALLQYIINGDNLLININFRNRKLIKKINIKDQAIDTKIFLLRGAINNKQDLTSVSSELYKILFKPIEVELIKSGINHVMLSLDGRLRYLPFTALWDENQFLIQKYTFTFFDEINDFASNKINTQQIRVAGFGVSKNIAGFSALPGVQAELKQIVRNKSGGIYPGKIILDNEFTFEELRSTLKQNYPVVHIATHFKFSPGTELNSFLLLGDRNHLDLSSLKTLDFKGVDLVTYSACQTGMGGGKDEDGKEIAGLSYISQKNGAKAVIASLWSVSDKSTSELMTKMYKILSKSSVSVSDALQQAKLELFRSSEYSHPFHWAGFQLYGNAR